MSFNDHFWKAALPRIRDKYRNPLTSADVLPQVDRKVEYEAFVTRGGKVFVNLTSQVDEQERGGEHVELLASRTGSRIMRFLYAFKEDSGPALPLSEGIEGFIDQARQVGCSEERLRAARQQWLEPPESDTMLLQLVTHGIGAPLVRNHPTTDNLYYVDLDFLKDFEVRPGWARYGACLRMELTPVTKALRLLSIEWGSKIVKPNDIEWIEAKRRFRTSLMMWVTLNHHILQSHLIISGTLSIATPATLAADHPIRRFLLPFHLHSARINTEALLLLLPQRGLVHRMTALSKRGLDDILGKAVDMFKFETVADNMRSQSMHPDDHPEWRGTGLSPFPYFEDAHLLWTTFLNLARDFVTLHYAFDTDVVADEEAQAFISKCNKLFPGKNQVGSSTREDLASLLAYFMFHASVSHEMYGGLLPYIQQPILCPMALRQVPSGGVTLGPRDHILLGQRLVLYTTTPAPKLVSDYSHLANDKSSVEFWKDKWIGEWATAQKEIDNRNRQRPVPFVNCSPRELEIAISV